MVEWLDNSCQSSFSSCCEVQKSALWIVAKVQKSTLRLSWKIKHKLCDCHLSAKVGFVITITFIACKIKPGNFYSLQRFKFIKIFNDAVFTEIFYTCKNQTYQCSHCSWLTLCFFIENFKPNNVATSPVMLRWLCDSPRTGCAWRTKPLYM